LRHQFRTKTAFYPMLCTELLGPYSLGHKGYKAKRSTQGPWQQNTLHRFQ